MWLIIYIIQLKQLKEKAIIVTIMEQTETGISQSKSSQLVCEICDYATHNRYDFSKHLETQKHKNMRQVMKEKSQKIANYACFCGTTFNNRTSLWRHKKACECELSQINKNELIVALLKQNNELLEIIKNQSIGEK